MTELFTLYGVQISNYTAKVRAYLFFKRILFQEVIPSNYVYEKILVPTIGFRMMPVLRTPEGELLQDSTDIIDCLEARFPMRSVYPIGPSQRLAALLLEAYAQDWVHIIAMYCRWTFPEQNHDYLIRELGRMREPTAQPDDQIIIGERSCALPRERLPLLGITDRTTSALRTWTDDLLGQLNDHFDKYDYLLGNRPCTADFTLMGPLYGHLYHDPYSASLMRRIAPQVIKWIERMNTEPVNDGDFLPDDLVPKSLFPIIRHACNEYLPAAFDAIQRVGNWVESHPGESIPRTVGEQEVKIAGVLETRAVWTSLQYMVQRPLRHYQASQGTARVAIDQLLSDLGSETALDCPIAHPLTRQNFLLWAK